MQRNTEQLAKYTARLKTSVFEQRASGDHEWVRNIGGESADGHDGIRATDPLAPVVRWKLLTAVDNSHERNNGRASLQLPEAVAILGLEASVTVPDGEGMVPHKHGHGDGSDGGANKRTVGEAPQGLAKGLRVTRNARDARAPYVQLGLVDSGNLLEIKGRRIEKEEADEVDEPERSVPIRWCLPENDAVVTVHNEENYPCISKRQRNKREENSPSARSDYRFCSRS